MIQANLGRGTPVFWPLVATPARTPATALAYLDELSPDVRAALLLDAEGTLAAQRPDVPENAEELLALLVELLAGADAAGGEEGAPAEVEVATLAGTLFVVRGERFTLAAIAERTALSSLMRYDLRHVLSDLDEAA